MGPRLHEYHVHSGSPHPGQCRKPAPFFLSLHNATLNGASTQQTSESIYSNYTREPVARSGAGWTITGNNPIVAGERRGRDLPDRRRLTGDTVTWLEASNGRLSGAGILYGFGALTSSLVVNNGILPPVSRSTR